ncbi:ABC1 family protein MCP2 [Cyphellophora attinorum]|uniref:ABC1 family protein MCP2 n=1 Tax=Cyphellophora attinorum TaxID=1664694 RepID=A0A0N1NZ54_9EURO|nr:ABC1 family protein MCP2 [Phialophora attinorum]KPI37073.1 ABC1 family protein MCP2 [Phialophora attinorum]
MLRACHKRCADRTLEVIEKNGSIFIKLGQHLSSMGYLLPHEWTDTFIPLQDKCPVSSYESIEEMFLKDTGRRIEDDFLEFSREPIGAASLAQVHTATLREGSQQVAVKVQHPSLEEWVPLDLSLTRFTFKTLKRAFPDYDLEWLSNEMEYSLPQELDFSQEGKNAIEAKRFFSEKTTFPLIIPSVISASKRILVMDAVRGARIDDQEYLNEHSISRSEVSATLARIFNTMIFQTGAPLHCDPHGGNIAIRHNPRRRRPYNFDIILYDHGLYRHPTDSIRRNYAKLWLAVIDGDDARMRKYSYELAGITDEQFPLFASAITGRDYRVLKKGGVATTARDQTEKEGIDEVFGENLLRQLVQLLGNVPRIILLILKTNDLTRSLDESLGSPEPMRPMMILAKYASWTVWEEQKEILRKAGGLLWPPGNAIRLLVAWCGFMRVELKLFAFERYLSVRRHLHLDS